MKISATALALAIVSSTVATTSVFAFTTSNVRTSSTLKNINQNYDTTLYNGMAAYDAQMKAAAAAANGIAATVPVPPPVGFAQGHSFENHSEKFTQRWRKKTKQLATLGPASSSFEMIEKLFLAGEKKHDHPIAILGDLQGPKLRVGQFSNPDGEHLPVGHTIRFDLDPTLGTSSRVMLPHPEIIEASDIGHVLLIDDGKVKVRVSAKGPGYLDCVVEVPGKIKDKKVCILLKLPVKRL
jgi:hypothetical protein